MAKVVNIAACFEKFNDTYSPKIVGDLNGQHVKLVWLEGDKVPWHIHDNEDEMFWVLEGTLDIFTRDEQIEVNADEFYIVPRGVEHRVVPRGRIRLLLFEPADISHTGDVRAEITKDQYDRLDL